jgi:hypothetical protein
MVEDVACLSFFVVLGLADSCGRRCHGVVHFIAVVATVDVALNRDRGFCTPATITVTISVTLTITTTTSITTSITA